MINTERLDAVVVGAGFAGLYMVKHLLDLGFSVRAYEAGGSVGGTWYWNRYPGARCDLESVDYSYSFSPALSREWEWSERYARQPEILRYLNFVADRCKLRPYIQLDTTVTGMVFDELVDEWVVMTDRGDRVRARFVVMATGVVSTPKPPEIDGLETFAGGNYHTGRWPDGDVDFSGERVGVIGTGSSAVQAIPIIAEQAKHLTVFQRTPNFTVPSRNYALDAAQQAELKPTLTDRSRRCRENPYGVPLEWPTRSALEVDAEERRRVYQEAWDESHLMAFRLTFNDLLTDERANDTVVEFMHEKIRGIVRDPATADRLLPRSFPFGTKRPCHASGYYETFNRPNVTLVDVRATPIVCATPAGLKTSERLHELDALVFATGWDAFTGAIARIDVRGIGGRQLSEKWADGPRAYLGLVTSRFPNMFLITGPGSPGPLSNMVVSIEQHVDWIGDCLASMRDHGFTRIDAGVDAENAWFEHVQEVVGKTLYLRANSWYLGANVPGKPRVFNPYLGGVPAYRAKCEEVAARGYSGFILTVADENSRARRPAGTSRVEQPTA
jgi:cyclohexanone monooxygenase